MPPETSLDAAVRNLGIRRTLRHEGVEIQLACLVREPDWRPLKAPWWTGKEVCVMGVDLEGNFLLRHCDGSVRHWNHREPRETLLARSVEELVSRIE